MMYFAGVPVIEPCVGVVITTCIFTVLTLVAVGLRLTTRIVLLKSFGIDEFFISLAALGALGYFIAVIYQVKFGLGLPAQLDILPQFLQSLLSTVVTYGITHTMCKLSVLFQCKRIFASAPAQKLFLGLIIWMSIYGAFCILSSLITCVPVAKYWNDALPGSCIDRMTLHFVLAGFNIANDIVILSAPMPFLKALQIPRRSKLILIAVFACAGLACVTAIIRLHALDVFNTAPIQDGPIVGVDIALWSGLEINIGIICACVPALKPFFVKFFPKMLNNIVDSSKRSKPDRSAQGSYPLRSYDDRTTGTYEDEHQKGGIQVHQSFEMKTSPTNDSSEENLVGKNAWSIECKARPQVVDKDGPHAV